MGCRDDVSAVCEMSLHDGGEVALAGRIQRGCRLIQQPDRTPNRELAVHQYRAEQRRTAEPRATQPGAGRDYLVLSGLGSRSLYTFGVVCGWADTGTMPEFAVITGVGGGAYAAVTAFAGRESLADLRRIFLSIDQSKIAHGDAWDFKRFRDVADESGALLMTDMAHIAGLVAAGIHPSPVPYSDFVTTTAAGPLFVLAGVVLAIMVGLRWIKKARSAAT